MKQMYKKLKIIMLVLLFLSIAHEIGFTTKIKNDLIDKTGISQITSMIDQFENFR